jgi:hypothetical protein
MSEQTLQNQTEVTITKKNNYINEQSVDKLVFSRHTSQTEVVVAFLVIIIYDFSS